MRRVVWAILAAVVLAGAASGILVYRDAQAAERSLASARRALRTGEAALTDDTDVTSARASFARAQQAARQARSRLDGPLWPVVSALPRVGGSTELARAAADLAESGGQLGTAVADQAGDLLDGSALAGILADGAVDLDRLAGVRDVVAGLPVEAVQAARDRIEAVRPADVLGRLRDDRTDAIGQADQILDRVDRVGAGLQAAAAFLGADGPRTYLVAAQNPAELRGTGGLIGYLTELQVADGAISLDAGASAQAQDELTRRTDLDSIAGLPEPVDRPAAFADRYDHIAAGQFIGSVNADPDLPTVAPVLLDLYAQEVGGDLDGVILVDPVGLGTIVAATGAPLKLPASIDTGGLGRTIPGQRIADVVMVDGYDALDGGGPAKKALDRAIVQAGFARLTSGGWDPVKVGRALGEAFATRHLQVFATDPTVQSTFQTLGLAGAMPATDGPGDMLAVTAVNAAADKSDVHVAHRMTGTVELTSLDQGAPARVTRTGRLTVELDNPLRPGDHDPYVTGSNDPLRIGGTRSERVDNALNRTWFSIWTPPVTQPASLREGDRDRPVRLSNIHDNRVFDYYLDTPSASTNAFTFAFDGSVDLRRDGTDLVYELTLWRQAKAIPDHWDLTVAAPTGWTVADATVDGGGAPTGMGAGGTDGKRLAASVEGGAARLVGAATRDATLTVRLSPR